MHYSMWHISMQFPVYLVEQNEWISKKTKSGVRMFNNIPFWTWVKYWALNITRILVWLLWQRSTTTLTKKREKKLCGGTFICMQSWTGILSGRAKRKNIEMKKYHQVLLHSTLRGVRSDQQIMANKPESMNISAHWSIMLFEGLRTRIRSNLFSKIIDQIILQNSRVLHKFFM